MIESLRSDPPIYRFKRKTLVPARDLIDLYRLGLRLKYGVIDPMRAAEEIMFIVSFHETPEWADSPLRLVCEDREAAYLRGETEQP